MIQRNDDRRVKLIRRKENEKLKLKLKLKGKLKLKEGILIFFETGENRNVTLLTSAARERVKDRWH
jgi:hypothetical protein